MVNGLVLRGRAVIGSGWIVALELLTLHRLPLAILTGLVALTLWGSAVIGDGWIVALVLPLGRAPLAALVMPDSIASLRGKTSSWGGMATTFEHAPHCARMRKEEPRCPGQENQKADDNSLLQTQVQVYDNGPGEQERSALQYPANLSLSLGAL